ncbi:unnamed protein product, partial [Polarella glacialis]
MMIRNCSFLGKSRQRVSDPGRHNLGFFVLRFWEGWMSWCDVQIRAELSASSANPLGATDGGGCRGAGVSLCSCAWPIRCVTGRSSISPDAAPAASLASWRRFMSSVSYLLRYLHYRRLHDESSLLDDDEDLVPAEDAQHRLWTTSTEYEELLCLQRLRNAARLEQRRAELARLKAEAAALSGEFEESQGAEARLRARDAEIAASAEASRCQLQLLSSVLALRDRQILDLEQLSEAKRRRLGQCQAGSGGSSPRIGVPPNGDFDQGADAVAAWAEPEEECRAHE